ncbi:FusB/FusC family EF-G-binding protein [Thalassobacillus hwangdonensis]|uniref:FusB/FusC family EF-G-binding protein n=1 Tax=Thalassobacillus hwangdonensis TaxID=546108 RepID=A0ABW3L8B3_9BACI
MEAFIHHAQYNFIREQGRKLVGAYVTSQDSAVLEAIESLVEDDVLSEFPNRTEDQQRLLLSIKNMNTKEDLDIYLEMLKAYVHPWKISEKKIEKLFPKVKKLNVPEVDEMDLRNYSYLSWIDQGSRKKFIVSEENGELIGVQGTFTPSNKDGICNICQEHESLGLFLTEKKGKELGTYSKKGNYICKDSERCNDNLTNLDGLQEFIERVQ